MKSTNDRLQAILAANPATLAKIDAILDGTDGRPKACDEDVRLITFTEAARRLNISRQTVYRLTKLGRLEVVPLDGINRIRLSSVFAYANGNKEGVRE